MTARPERCAWTTNGAVVSLGRLPMAALVLDLGAGVSVTIEGLVVIEAGGGIVAESGALVTITGRLSDDATLPLRRAEQ